MAVQLVGGIAYVATSAILKEDLDFLVVVVVGMVMQFASANEKLTFLGSDAVEELSLGAEGVQHRRVERPVGNPDGAEVAVEQMLGEGAEDGVGMAHPAFKGHDYVAIVEQGETVEQLVVGDEILLGVVVAEEIVEGHEVNAKAVAGCSQFSGTAEDVEEQVVGSDNGFVKVDLPVHQAARDDEFLDRIDAFLVHHQFIVLHIEHADDAVGAHDALANTGKETVAAQIVKAVHVELAAHQLMEEMLGIAVVEDADGSSQAAPELLVETLHVEARAYLVGHVGQRMLGGMGERAVADVVHEDGQLGPQHLVVGELHPFYLQHLEGTSHEVEGTQHVAEACMHGAWVDQIGEAQLLDAPLPLEKGVAEHVEDDVVLYG